MNKNTLIFGLLLFILGFSACKKDDGGTTTTTTQNEAQQVFQEFWDTYDRYYPLMHRKNIVWQEVHDTYYPQLKSTTTDQELLGHMKTIMNTVIKDGHSGVTYNQSEEATYEDVAFHEGLQQMVAQNLSNKINWLGASESNGYLSYGTLKSDSDIGYIQSKNFEPLSDSEESEYTAFKNIVDEALQALKDKKGIVVDVRTNGGGQGPFAFYLAGRFYTSASPTEIVRKRVKAKTGDTEASLTEWISQPFNGYNEPRAEEGVVAGIYDIDEHKVSATGAFQYGLPVALLTSRGTASAAEYFTVAMKTQNHVKTFGNTTFGIFAGSEHLTLKKGAGKWVTRVSIEDVEMLYNGTFQSFEGIGIAPDEVLLPTDADVSAGKEIHLEAAITYIN